MSALGCLGISLSPLDDANAEQRKQPHFPTGIALHPSGNLLAVVSSNFDAFYENGAVLVADLTTLDAQLTFVDPDDAPGEIFSNFYHEAILIPSYGHRPVFSADGAHLIVATRSGNLMTEIEVDLTEVGDGGSGTAAVHLSCAAELDDFGNVKPCGTGTRALQLEQNDPYEIAIYQESATEIQGAATFLRSSFVTFFRLRPDRDDASRLQLRGSLELGEGVRGIRSVALLPRGLGRTPLLLLAVEREDPALTTETNMEISWIDPDRRTEATIRTLSLEALTGARSARAIVSTPEGDAFFVALRRPDGLARIETDVVGSTIVPRLGGLAVTCDDPTAMRFVRFTLPSGEVVSRLIMTCYADNTVAAFDPITLRQTDAIRNFGLGPFDLAVDTQSATPRIFVTYFDDDTVGIIDLVDADGVARLVPRARIGEPDLREVRE